MMLLSKVFGAAVIGIASLVGCSDNSAVFDFRYALNELTPDPNVDRALGVMTGGVRQGTMRFNGAEVSAWSSFTDEPEEGAPVVTFDAINRNLCHRNVTDDDRNQAVCNEQNSLSMSQRAMLDRNICQGAILSGNRVYKQLFCVRPKLT